MREFVAKAIERRKDTVDQMFIDAVEAKRGVQVPVGNIVHTAEFAFRVAGVDGEWDEAQRRATGLAEQAVEDFLDTIETDESITLPGNVKSDGHQTAPCKKPELQMVELIFDATNSKHRSDRIMRATSEEMSFEPSSDGDGWICTAHNGRKFEVDVDKGAGLGRCNCEDFINRGISSKMPCKHIYALVMSGERFWDSTKRSNQNL
ncbi:MAG: SWIM zinc finger domain-containing protein (plasmid) [Candidatus Methanoperedens sp.]|nr:MAG: SWIM zinc finger domain-containing protein [Candidatus Methanoperedens sp.]